MLPGTYRALRKHLHINIFSSLLSKIASYEILSQKQLYIKNLFEKKIQFTWNHERYGNMQYLYEENEDAKSHKDLSK